MKRLINIIKRQTGNSEGFTLLEAMISLLVFTIGILGMLTLQTTSIKNNKLSEDVQINTVEATAEIEELMATDFLDQRLNAKKTYTTSDPRYSYEVKPVDDTNIPGGKRVQVISTFTPYGGGRPQTITLNIYKPDIDHVTP
jgi:Tfp pilus assembly protein PilV